MRNMMSNDEFEAREPVPILCRSGKHRSLFPDALMVAPRVHLLGNYANLMHP